MPVAIAISDLRFTDVQRSWDRGASTAVIPYQYQAAAAQQAAGMAAHTVPAGPIEKPFFPKYSLLGQLQRAPNSPAPLPTGVNPGIQQVQQYQNNQLYQPMGQLNPAHQQQQQQFQYQQGFGLQPPIIPAPAVAAPAPAPGTSPPVQTYSYAGTQPHFGVASPPPAWSN